MDSDNPSSDISKKWELLHLPSVYKSSLNNSKQLNSSNEQYENIKKTNIGSSFALHQSVLDGRLKQVNYFLKLGLNVNSKDKFGRTSLILACLCDFEEYGLQVAKLLLKYGADLNARDSLGQTAMFIACTEKREKFFDNMIDNHYYGIDFKLKDNDGNCLLNHAAIHGTHRMLRKIIERMQEKKIELDQRNNTGFSALLLAIQYDNYLSAYSLVKDGQSSPSLKDNVKYYNALEWLLERIEANKCFIKPNQAKSFRDSSASFYTQDSPSFLKSSNKKTKTIKNNLNYKSWLHGNNQYFQGERKCEHINNPNYSVDHHKSRYVPHILKSHYLQHYVSQSEFQPDSSSLNLRNSQTSKLDEKEVSSETSESEQIIDENTDTKDLIQKLYETIYLKMSDSYKTKQFYNSNTNKPSSPTVDSEKKETKPSKRASSRTQSQNKKNIEGPTKLDEVNKQREDTALVSNSPPLVSNKFQDFHFEANIFNTESLRKTPKLLALQPIYSTRQSTTKEAVHSMLDLYVSSYNQSNEIHDNYFGRISPSVESRYRANFNINKEKSNMSEKFRKRSMVSANSHVHFKGELQ